jgi:hypothetical protein
MRRLSGVWIFKIPLIPLWKRGMMFLKAMDIAGSNISLNRKKSFQDTFFNILMSKRQASACGGCAIT